MLGFGILFTGMSLMDTGVAPCGESAVFQNLFVTMTNPILGVLVGVVVAVIISPPPLRWVFCRHCQH